MTAFEKRAQDYIAFYNRDATPITRFDHPPMDLSELPISIFSFLEELRSIAQLGLNYAHDPYDLERYKRLLRLAAVEYEKLTGIPETEILERFHREVGHVTPKVGVDAAIFDADGRLLLMRRSDDGCWCLPCGWAELGERPETAIAREVREETGLTVEVGTLIQVFSRLPGEFGPHTAVFLLYHCVPTAGELRLSDEGLELGYFHPAEVTRWHRDHRVRAVKAGEFRRESNGKKANNVPTV